MMNEIVNINTLEDLKRFRDNVNGGTTYEGQTVILTADLDMSSIDNWDAIGTISNQFKGTFEGGDHKISNLKIDKNKKLQGLFGYIDRATIQNLGLENVDVKGSWYVGGLVGRNRNGTIENSYVTGKVTGESAVGGLVGSNEFGTIKNSYVTGEVTGTGNFAGGLVGFNNSGTVTNSYAAGKVTGISNVGGLVGLNDSGTIETSYAAGEVTGTDYVGGLVGYSSGTIETSYAAGEVTGTSNVGGLVGGNYGTVTNSYYDKDTTGQSDTSKGTPLETAKMTGNAATTNMTGFDFTNVWGIKATEGIKSYYPYLRVFGEESAQKVIRINNIDDLQEFRDSVNSGTTYEGVEVTLTADIDMSKVDNWNAIGTISHQFKGTFDGGGYKISNLKIDKNKKLQGLFGVINGATIKNLGLENVNVKGTGTYYVGGLVGWNSDGTIKNCYGAGKVTGNNRVGGLVGYSLCGTIKNSYWEGQVKGKDSVGGLVGYNDNGTIENCYGEVLGKVKGKNSVGGLVGMSCGSSAKVENSYVTGTGSVIGIGEIGCVGGLVGANEDGTIENCYASVSVTGIEGVGGLVGYNDSGTIENCYGAGSVTGEDEVGGLVGANGGIIKNSYATGTVTGTYYVGGLVGDNTGIVTNSYYNKDNAGVPDNGFGTPLSSKEFQEKSAVWVNQNDKGGEKWIHSKSIHLKI